MTTRAGSLANSRQVKIRLVKTLFGPKYNRRGREAHKKLDYASYSYSDLRSAYLDRLQILHPDKQFASRKRNRELASIPLSTHENNNFHHHNERHQQSYSSKSPYKNQNEEFSELREAWEDYEKWNKCMKHSSMDSKNENSSFTMFGVGCSFADSPAERDKRSEIMEQACRGWFSAGMLSEECEIDSNDGSNHAKNVNVISKESLPLVDDDMFVLDSKSSPNHDGLVENGNQHSQRGELFQCESNGKKGQNRVAKSFRKRRSLLEL
mmetsp:Transcript_14132/g.20181  ORF Transcript_14132/g.20181 Transcript_14132/m.20181 type:complete len:266 (-) Transcript_14132:53-850(-)